MSYAVKDVFATIQGEGEHAGTPAVFLRLAGCNMWSGRDEDRIRDSQRHGAHCPRWCDTDFVGGAKMTAEQVAAAVRAKYRGQPIVVVSGGEPLLQVDDELLDVLHEQLPSPTVCIETNGTVEPRFDRQAWLDKSGDFGDPLVWVTMSPKLPRAATKLGPDLVSELKLVWPDHNPSDWEDFDLRFLQPRAHGALRDGDHERELARRLIAGDYPGWKLSLQTHKVLEIP